MIWKSSPSRIRRATLRMTLESSTTRQVLMFSPLLPSVPWRDVSRPDENSSPVACLRRHQVGCDLQHAIDIEDDHEVSVESVDAAGELGHAGIEVDGVFLAAGVGESEN